MINFPLHFKITCALLTNSCKRLLSFVFKGFGNLVVFCFTTVSRRLARRSFKVPTQPLRKRSLPLPLPFSSPTFLHGGYIGKLKPARAHWPSWVDSNDHTFKMQKLAVQTVHCIHCPGQDGGWYRTLLGPIRPANQPKCDLATPLQNDE